MPSLRQLECHIEWANTGTPFEEYGTAYGDSVVETYIVIPASPQSFTIRVQSKGYIDEGLAVLVFTDGEYQCNRNRMNLKPRSRGLPKHATEIDFRLRQKEKPVQDGTFLGREWRWATHNRIATVPEGADPRHFESLGTIEIIVLRCRHPSDDDNRSTSSSGVDTDPLDKNPDADDGDSVFDDTTQDTPKSPPQSHAAPAGGDGGFMGSFFDIFDGAHDQHDRPNFGGDGPTDGYWTYHPTSQYYGAYTGGQHWGPQPGYPQAPPENGPIPQPLGPEKHVHFNMGGIPNTRARPPPSQSVWPDVAPPRLPPMCDPSSHGAGQQNGFSVPPYQIPFHAIPPFAGPQAAPGPCVQHGWGGGGYMPYAAYQNYGYGGGYGNHPQGYTHQSQEYAGRPVDGPAAPRDQNTNAATGSGDSGNNSNNNQNGGWGDHGNAGNVSGNTRNGDDWRKPNNNDPEGASGWGGTSDNANKNGNDSGWPNDDQNGNSNANTGEAWGDKFEKVAGAQDSGDWNNKDNGDNTGKPGDQSWGNDETNRQDQNQGDDSWGNDQNNEPAHDSWSVQQDAAQNSENQQQLPGNFPRTFSPGDVPRALHGPFGQYYTFRSSSAGEVKPEVEEEPRYDVPSSYIARTGSTHQVQPGRGYLYLHKRSSPQYIDSIEEPYARFVFKYRTTSQLANEIGVRVDVEPSGNPEVQALAGKSKEEIIEMLIHAKSALGGKIPEELEETAKKEGGQVKPVPVPAPERRVKNYNIPVRNVRASGLGISAEAGKAFVLGYQKTPPQGQGGSGGGWDGDSKNAGGGSGGWANDNNADAGGDGGDIGGWGSPGARPASPDRQGGDHDWSAEAGSGGWDNNQNQTSDGGRAAVKPSSGW